MFRKTTLALLFAVVVPAAACKKKAEKQDGPVPPPVTEPADAAAPAEPPPPAAVLAIEAATLEVERGKAKLNPDDPTAIVIDASGEVKAERKDGPKVVGKVTPDGKFADETDKIVATIAADGTVTFEGEPEKLTIAEDGTTTRDGKELVKIGDDGTLAGEMTKEMSEKLTYKGPPGARRAMMFVFFSAMMPKK